MNQPVIDIMARLTAAKFWHVPVVEEGGLAGIVSIGDVVKWCLDELKHGSARRCANDGLRRHARLPTAAVE